MKLASPNSVGVVYFLVIILAGAFGAWLVVGFALVLFHLHLIAYTLSEILSRLEVKGGETFQERKKRLWKEYEDSIGPPGES